MTGALLLAGVLVAQVPEPPSPPAIAWIAPPACPDASALTAAISRRLGRPLADDDVRLAGTITQHATSPRFRLRLDLTLGGLTRTRTLTAERCPSLIDAAALLVALQLTNSEPPPAPAEPPPREPDQPIATPPPPPAPPPIVTPPRRPPSPADRLAAEVDLLDRARAQLPLRRPCTPGRTASTSRVSPRVNLAHSAAASSPNATIASPSSAAPPPRRPSGNATRW